MSNLELKFQSMMKTPRKLVVTSALPYANGPLHLGHMVEFIQADIWVRFQRMQGHLCIYVCGDDAHGTPIMLKAEQLGLTPEALIADIKRQHEQDLAAFHIALDQFYTTHSSENQSLVNQFYQNIKANQGFIEHTINQAFDPIKQMFLPDRFIKGQCPRCQTTDQYGDHCEACGATYNPEDLIEPISVLTQTTPIIKTTKHLFFQLPNYQSALQSWLETACIQSEVRHKLNEWFEQGLKEWDITRDQPYFGFTIPDRANQYFYVWLDAPIGYLASLNRFCQTQPQFKFETIIAPESDFELYHFIGKDIIYFHALFWPAVLLSAGYRLPSGIFAHGFLTISGKKMSKSRGTFIEARTYREHLDPEHLRYYFASKLSNHVQDIDFSSKDYFNKVNADLIGKFVNLASRCASFIEKYFSRQLSKTLPDLVAYQQFIAHGHLIAKCYEQRNFMQAVRLIMQATDQANQYINQHQPWILIKQADQAPAVHSVCTMGLNFFRALTCWLKPILPVMAQQIEAWLNLEPLTWDSLSQPLLNHLINPYQPLSERITDGALAALEDSSTPTTKPLVKALPTITMNDVAKLDLRVAKIIAAEPVAGADKLLKLTVDLGDEQRQVFAGIKKAYQSEQLIGRLTVVVANLAPRTMRFGISEAMVLAAADPSKQSLWLLAPDQGAEPGMSIS